MCNSNICATAHGTIARTLEVIKEAKEKKFCDFYTCAPVLGTIVRILEVIKRTE